MPVVLMSDWYLPESEIPWDNLSFDQFAPTLNGPTPLLRFH